MTASGLTGADSLRYCEIVNIIAYAFFLRITGGGDAISQQSGVLVDLHILLDYSMSMNMHVSDGKTRIMLMKEHLATAMKSMENDVEATLYSFSRDRREIGKAIAGSNTEWLFHKLGNRGSDRTVLWDNLWRIIQECCLDSKSKVLCITDGEDSGSTHTFQQVADLAARRNVELRVIDLLGRLQTGQLPDKQEIIGIDIEKYDELKNVLKQQMSSSQYWSFKRPAALNVSVAIVPVIDCSDDVIKFIGDTLRTAIPFLEGATGLRYYPVPTYIVDEYLFRQVCPRKIPEQDDLNQNLLDDFWLVLDFIEAVTLTYHSAEWPGIDDELPIDVISIMRGNYEALISQSLCRLVKGEIPQTHPACSVKGVTEKGDIIQDSHALLKLLQKIISKIRQREGATYKVMADYFEDIPFRNRHNLFDAESYPPREPTVPDAWRRHLSSRDLKKLDTVLSPVGVWSKHIGDIEIALELAIKILFAILPRLGYIKRRHKHVVKMMHTYGVYLHADDTRNKTLAKELKRQGFPTWFYQHQAGKVLLCLGDIVEAVKRQVYEHPAYREDELRRVLIEGTLVHEHGHAITYEGVGFGPGDEYYRNSTTKGKKYNTVSETIAEWSEMQYFRDDSEAFDIVREHASSDDIKHWPYAGALLLETTYGGDYTHYRNLLNLFRLDAVQAYSYLMGLKSR